MIDAFANEHLHDHLRWVREALVWKLDGLCELDRVDDYLMGLQQQGEQQ